MMLEREKLSHYISVTVLVFYRKGYCPEQKALLHEMFLRSSYLLTVKSTFSCRKRSFICWSYYPLSTPVYLQLIIIVLTKISPWEVKGLTYSALPSSTQKKILLFKVQDALQVTTFHQSLLRHESAVARSQQGPLQQLQTAAGSDAAWVCLLNRREQEAFCCLCCLKLDKAEFYNLFSLSLCLEHAFHRKLHWVRPAHCTQGMFHSACLYSQNVLLQQSMSHDRESHVGDGVRDAVRCGCRGKWLGCSQSPRRNRVPRHHSSPLQFLVRHVVQTAFHRKSLLVVRHFSHPLKVKTYLFNEGFFSMPVINIQQWLNT